MDEVIASCSLCTLEEKSAIITGAAQGIGFAIARRFAEAGADLLLTDINESALRDAAERLRAEGGTVEVVVADIGDLAAPQKIVGRCVASYGRVDVLVNNAGIFPSAPALAMTADFFDRVLHINLRGLIFLSQEAGKDMVARGKGGKIINIGSIDSLRPSMVGLAAYDASKGGVLMFTRNFALEMAPHGVQVNAILPGGIATEGASLPPEMKDVTDAFIRRIPMGRLGAPDEIARVALFLATSGSDYMTGSHVVVDGGALLT